jgi:hypothetical protein
LRQFVRIASVIFLLWAPSYAADLTPPVTLFSTEEQAQAHCPADIVVWLNTPTGIYHFKGERWYRHTKHGGFVCKAEADQFGDRATRNGQ